MVREGRTRRYAEKKGERRKKNVIPVFPANVLRRAAPSNKAQFKDVFVFPRRNPRADAPRQTKFEITAPFVCFTPFNCICGEGKREANSGEKTKKP